MLERLEKVPENRKAIRGVRWGDVYGGVGRAGRKTQICLKRAWSGRDNNRLWAAGISRISVVCVVIK